MPTYISGNGWKAYGMDLWISLEVLSTKQMTTYYYTDERYLNFDFSKKQIEVTGEFGDIMSSSVDNMLSKCAELFTDGDKTPTKLLTLITQMDKPSLDIIGWRILRYLQSSIIAHNDDNHFTTQVHVYSVLSSMRKYDILYHAVELSTSISKGVIGDIINHGLQK